MTCNRNPVASHALLVITALLGAGCGGDPTGALGSLEKIVSVSVTSDSSVIAVGHATHVSLTALDSAGATVTAPGVVWTSLTPEIATVGPSGGVDTKAPGVAIIEGRVAGFSGRAELTLTPGLEAPSHDFSDATIGPYNNLAASDLDFPLDPTGSGRGNVARFHYRGSNGDTNLAMEYRYPRSWSQPIYFKGDFYLPDTDLAAHNIIRKLIYWQSHRNFEKYPEDGGKATGRTVVVLAGADLVVDAVYNPASTTGKTADDVRTVATLARALRSNTWYTLEVYQQMESALGRADGVLQIWLDGQLVFDKKTMRWADPAWVGSRTGGVPFEASDIYFERFRVGDQVNWERGTFDEFRYWDNVQFSTRPFEPTS